VSGSVFMAIYLGLAALVEYRSFRRCAGRTAAA
jgi:hypothetical protein